MGHKESSKPVSRFGRLLYCSLVVCAMFAGAVKAQDSASAPAPVAAAGQGSAPMPAMQSNEAPMASTGVTILQTLGGLGVVCSLIVFGFLAAKKFAPQYFTRSLGGKNLKVIETVSMGEKRAIALIQVGTKRLLVGNTAQQITLLAQLDEQIAVVSDPEPVPAPSPKSSTESFRNLYDVEKSRGKAGLGRTRTISPDVRAKMRQLREALEH